VDLIGAASSGPLKASDVERAAMEINATPAEMLDRLAHRIAEGYANGNYDFTFCDSVMNEVFRYATRTSLRS